MSANSYGFPLSYITKELLDAAVRFAESERLCQDAMLMVLKARMFVKEREFELRGKPPGIQREIDFVITYDEPTDRRQA